MAAANSSRSTLGEANHWDGRTAPKRVLHIVPALFAKHDGVIGGAERFALELARHMAEVVPTSLLTFGEQARTELIGRLQIRVLGNPWYVRGQPSNPFTLSMLPELVAADVAHCHQWHVLSSSLTAIFCRATRRKVFVTDLGGGGWDISAYCSTERWFNGHLHLSNYSREISGQSGRPWAHVIGAGVDSGRFSPADLPERALKVLFVGRLLPHKGVNYLIEAIPQGVALEVIGQPYDPRYLSDLQTLAKGKTVNFHHDYDDGQLIAAYRSALCLVLPSVYVSVYGERTEVPELFGQTLLEAMACSTPVICTAVASMPEIVEDGVTGFIVPPNDPVALGAKIVWLSAHPAEAADMGRRARMRVIEKYGWPAVVRRCLEIYSA